MQWKWKLDWGERGVENAIEPWEGEPADCLWDVPVYSVLVLFLPCILLCEGVICVACSGLYILNGLWIFN